MKLISAIGLLLVTCIGFAQDNFPPTCQALPVKGETLNLQTKQPVIILIHNRSENDIWVTHPVSEPNASAGWSSRLSAGNWSALALDKDNFELSCIESRPGHEQQIACEGMIDACNWSAVKVPKTETGTFWAGEDMTLPSLIAALGGRGFVVPTP